MQIRVCIKCQPRHSDVEGGRGKDGRVGGWQLADQREKPLPGLTDSHGS